MRPVQLDPEAQQSYTDNMRANLQHQVDHWEQRTEDTMDLLLDAVALMAAICCEVRTDLEVLRAERSKRYADSAQVGR